MQSNKAPLIKILKLTAIFLFIPHLFGCAVILEKGSIEQNNNEHYVEIDAGGFTTKTAMAKALDRYSEEICGNDEHETLTYEIHPRSTATIPGKTCRSSRCSDHFVLKAVISCDSPSFASLDPLQKSEVIALPEDAEKFKEMFMGDSRLNAIQQYYGRPDFAMYKEPKKVYWLYREKDLIIEIERKRDILLGWLTNTITIRKTALDIFDEHEDSIKL